MRKGSEYSRSFEKNSVHFRTDAVIFIALSGERFQADSLSFVMNRLFGFFQYIPFHPTLGTGNFLGIGNEPHRRSGSIFGQTYC